MSEPWRYYPAFRSWHRGDRRVIVPRCTKVLDQSKVLARAGVVYGGQVQCDLEAGHDGNHVVRFQGMQWSDKFALAAKGGPS